MLTRKRPVRIPHQKRGISRKVQIIEAAYTYICAKGYSKLTTPKLAKATGVSVGCLYGYFKNKDDLFQAVLNRYSQQFDAMREDAFRKLQIGGKPIQDQLSGFLKDLTKIHEASKELNAEMKQLSFRDQSMKARLNGIEVKVQEAIKEWLLSRQNEISIGDLKAVAVILMDMVNSLVDRVVFGHMPISRHRLIEEGVNALVSVVGLRND